MAATEVQTAAAATVDMQVTQSTLHIMLSYSGFSIRSSRACVSSSVKYRGVHFAQIHQLV